MLTGSEVQLGATCLAQPLTVVTAQRVTWNVQQPLLPDCRTQVELGLAIIEQEYIGIVLDALGPRFREDEMRFVRHVSHGVAETTAARQLHTPSMVPCQ
jgi:hypothetical protein